MSCGDPEASILDRKAFQDHWWELETQQICYNFHTEDKYSGKDVLLIVAEQGSISSLGSWTFEIPIKYQVENYEVLVEQEEECWRVDLSGEGNDLNELTCECTLAWQ